MSKLPSSGVLSAEDLKAHFGSASNSLSQYYEGGEVPDNSINDAIPNTSSALNAGSNFYGASNEAPLTASVSPTSVSGTGSESADDPGTTDPATCSASGGGGNTFSWTQISGDPEIYATAPTSATTSFEVSGNPPTRGHYSGVFQCTVTSADGQTASDTVTIDDINIIL